MDLWVVDSGSGRVLKARRRALTRRTRRKILDFLGVVEMGESSERMVLISLNEEQEKLGELLL